MALGALLPVEQRGRQARSKEPAQIQEVAAEPAGFVVIPQSDPAIPDLIRALRALHLLLRSARLYDRQHPRLLQSLDGA